MRFINLGSFNSQFNGIEYYEEKRVHNINKLNDSEFTAEVEGNNTYNVFINIDKPRKSTCTCPFAFGRRVVCKHMIAAYITIFPHKKKEFNDDLEQSRIAAEKYEEEERLLKEKEIKKYVKGLTAKEVRQKLIEKLMDEYDESKKRYYW